LSPSGAGTNFEVRISRQAQYTNGTPVFTNSTIRILLQDNRGSVLIPQGVSYTFADGGPYENWRAQYFTAAELDNPSISGDGADPDGDGIPNLVEFAFNLNPRLASHTSLPRGFVQNVSGQDYFHIQYTQRNAPAGVQYLLQTSPDLFSWSAASFTPVSSTDNGDGTSLVTVRLQNPITGTPHQFVRVAIQRP
jgi:alpha-L-arabinofuranosidase